MQETSQIRGDGSRGAGAAEMDGEDDVETMPKIAQVVGDAALRAATLVRGLWRGKDESRGSGGFRKGACENGRAETRLDGAFVWQPGGFWDLMSAVGISTLHVLLFVLFWQMGC